MKNSIARTTLAVPVGLCLLLAGCGSIWPFGGDKAGERPRAPPNSTEFQCDGGKRFYLRYLDNGAGAWVIFPDREVRLDKVADAPGMRYGNGIAILDVSGSTATLTDGPNSFANCKAAVAEKSP
jgi:membrane-bound inhibitor of C-type lysozyme